MTVVDLFAGMGGWDHAARDLMRPCDTPAPTVDTEAGSRWVLRSGQTVAGGPPAERDVDDPALTVGTRADQWVFDRPTATIAGDPRAFPPGGHIAHDGRDNTAMTGRSENAIRLTLAEGLTLQGFPPDWPVQGTKTAQWTQVGNAVPPPLARAVLAQFAPAQECRICGTVFERTNSQSLCSGPCRREAHRRQNAAYAARPRAAGVWGCASWPPPPAPPAPSATSAAG